MRLQDIPNELLLTIVDQIDDRATLCSLAGTCSKFQLVSEPHIYKSLLILDGSKVKAVLAKSFVTRPARLSAIQDLAVRYRFTAEEGIEELEPFLYRMAQLRHLLIEAPCCNDTPWTYNEPWKSHGRIDFGKLFEASLSTNSSITPRPLAHLESLTVHSHNAGIGNPHNINMGVRSRYELGKDAVIFLHPTLRSIKLSCFDIGPDFINYRCHDYEKAHKSTALKTLIFEECNISAAGLETLLALPKALEQLTLGERMYHTDKNYWEVLANEQSTVRRALGFQRQSLWYLKHIGGVSLYGQPANLITAHDLWNVTTLEIDYYSFFITAFLKRKFPPQLQTLKILDAPIFEVAELGGLMNNLVLHNDTQNLRRLSLVTANSLRVLFQSDAQRVDLIRANVQHFGKQFRQRKIDFYVYYTPEADQHFIPPFMYGEKVPVDLLAYSSLEASISDDDPNSQPLQAEELAENVSQ